MAKKKCISFLFIFCCISYCFSQSLSLIDSAKIKSTQLKSDSEKVKIYFFIADEYMNVEQYDSAQIWLNKIHELLPVKNNSLDNYLLLTRQAEVYYYNNLQQLGMQESRRGLAMAQALNDSLLLADSYNFLGLFYMNIDSAAASVPYFKKGLLYAHQPTYPVNYASLTKPHHLYGNLAEAYFKLNSNDSALWYYVRSLQKANEINWDRGIAVAHTGLGDVFFALNKTDSALYNYTKGVSVAINAKDIDVALVCYSGMAKCYSAKQNSSAVAANLSKGFNLLKDNPNLNRFYALNFLNTGIDIYRGQNNTGDLIKALELKSTIEKANIDGNNKQIQTILNAGMANEKRVLSLEVDEAKQKQQLANTRLLMALTGIAFLIITFFVYRYFQNQKLAVSKMRQKISQDLHDDIGASLSSLQIYGAIAEQSIITNPDKAIEMVQKISGQSKEIMENMSDIVWSMKSSSVNNTSIEARIKNYASELLQDRNIEFTCIIQPGAEAVLENMKARRNVLLIAKEVLNNIAKYSKAAGASLHMYVDGKNWVLQITDNGIGFDKEKNTGGNGLKNIAARCEELKGKWIMKTEKNKGTNYIFILPVTVLTNNGW
jgi:signal transduction histidine kinase